MHSSLLFFLLLQFISDLQQLPSTGCAKEERPLRRRKKGKIGHCQSCHDRIIFRAKHCFLRSSTQSPPSPCFYIMQRPISPTAQDSIWIQSSSKPRFTPSWRRSLVFSSNTSQNFLERYVHPVPRESFGSIFTLLFGFIHLGQGSLTTLRCCFRKIHTHPSQNFLERFTLP